MEVRVLFGLLFLLCSYSAAIQAERITLQQQSLSISEKLQNLKQQSHELTELCKTLQTDLQKSQIEVAQWKAKSTELSESLMHINQELTDCYENITRLETQKKQQQKVSLILLSILSILTLIKAVGYALYFKGFRVPRWLDILI